MCTTAAQQDIISISISISFLAHSTDSAHVPSLILAFLYYSFLYSGYIVYTAV